MLLAGEYHVDMRQLIVKELPALELMVALRVSLQRKIKMRSHSFWEERGGNYTKR